VPTIPKVMLKIKRIPVAMKPKCLYGLLACKGEPTKDRLPNAFRLFCETVDEKEKNKDHEFDAHFDANAYLNHQQAGLEIERLIGTNKIMQIDLPSHHRHSDPSALPQ
jgi:hypothetical protein